MTMPWEVNAKDHRAFGSVPHPGVCRAGSVQARLWPEAIWIQVPITILGCFEGANVIGVFICLVYLENPEL